jgi:telomere length regulation protein
MMLFTIAKSSIQTHGISNRLKASSQRAQWLGMIVGMTLSELVDKATSRLVFEDEAMQTPEAKWYQALVHMNDKIGNIDHLESPKKSSTAIVAIERPRRLQSPRKHQGMNTSVKSGVSIPQASRIVELLDDEDDEDIVPYAKPDSDPEDEEEDPTLVERDKPKPPVYIRDLLIGLRETENYERHRLALETSQALIRRKATFGKEVSDHAEELASILNNLNDQFEMDDFLELRQEALTSLLVAQPKIVAPLLARSCFEGNFSVQQRAAMLTALALGVRELAGYRDEDRAKPPSFPSKELPRHLQQIYSEKSRLRLTKASDQLEQGMVEPLALNAADQLSGPNALKVRTFSSRMEVQKKTSKVIKNPFAKDIAEWFFFPLIGGWWAQLQSL